MVKTYHIAFVYPQFIVMPIDVYTAYLVRVTLALDGYNYGFYDNRTSLTLGYRAKPSSYIPHYWYM